MKLILSALILPFTFSVANAGHLECNDGKNRSTEIEFYSHWGKITFQMSTPYNDEYLYILGHCYSENEIGLPYDCEPASTEKSDRVEVSLLRGGNGQPVAKIVKHFDLQVETTQLIACELKEER